FLASSLQRSRRARADRPLMARQARAWAIGGAVAWTAACVASRGSNTVRLRPLGGLFWWLTVWQMLDWHLGMAEGGDGRARERLSRAAAVTLVRFWLVPLPSGAGRSPVGLPG